MERSGGDFEQGPLAFHNYAIKQEPQEPECISAPEPQLNESTSAQDGTEASAGIGPKIKCESNGECADELKKIPRKEKVCQYPEQGEICRIQNISPVKQRRPMSSKQSTTKSKRGTNKSPECKGQPRTRKGKTSYTCTDCSKRWHHKSNLLTHQRSHTGEKPYACSECKKGFTKRSTLISHERTHTGEKPYTCGECGKSFRQSSTFLNHEKIHKERPYMCNECGKTFCISATLNKHQQIHVGNYPYTCRECGKSFRQSSYIKQHQIHKGVLHYLCSDCGKRFRKKLHLIIHQRTHTGEKPYLCSDCGKRFSQKPHLIIHQRKHTGEKPYVCKECGKDFSCTTHLVAHERIHTGEKPYACGECGKCFNQSSHLVTHHRTHTGETPYTCTVCGESFRQRSNLNLHQGFHTGENPFTCPQCGKIFRQKTELFAHQITHNRKKQSNVNLTSMTVDMEGNQEMGDHSHKKSSEAASEDTEKDYPQKLESMQSRNWNTRQKRDLMWSCICAEILAERRKLTKRQEYDKMEEIFRKKQPSLSAISRKNLMKHKNYLKNHELFNNATKQQLRQEVLEYLRGEEIERNKITSPLTTLLPTGIISQPLKAEPLNETKT